MWSVRANWKIFQITKYYPDHSWLISRYTWLVFWSGDWDQQQNPLGKLSAGIGILVLSGWDNILWLGKYSICPNRSHDLIFFSHSAGACSILNFGINLKCLYSLLSKLVPNYSLCWNYVKTTPYAQIISRLLPMLKLFPDYFQTSLIYQTTLRLLQD